MRSYKGQSPAACCLLWLLIVPGHQPVMPGKDKVYFRENEQEIQKLQPKWPFFFFKLRNLTNIPKATATVKFPREDS